jgi:predicted nucleic acid-binding protein
VISAFLDASVFVSACISSQGASHEIIRESTRGAVLLVISDYVLRETERSLARKRPDALPVLQELLANVDFNIVNPTPDDILEAAKYTDIEDAPVVAAAKKAGLRYLVSLNRRHLVGVSEVSEGSGLTIILPEELLRRIRQDQQE